MNNPISFKQFQRQQPQMRAAPVCAGKPIIHIPAPERKFFIRYIDRDLLPIFEQLNQLTHQYHVVVRAPTVNKVAENRDTTIQELLRSTTELKDKVSQLVAPEQSFESSKVSSQVSIIIQEEELFENAIHSLARSSVSLQESVIAEDASGTCELSRQRLNITEQQEHGASPMKELHPEDQSKVSPQKQPQICEIGAEGIDIIDVVNRASDKIEQLQDENRELKSLMEKEKARMEATLQENEELKRKFSEMQSEKERTVSIMQLQIEEVKTSYKLIRVNQYVGDQLE